jgi:dolichyl-phosphate-mannose--protein O-mannosyl transferase
MVFDETFYTRVASQLMRSEFAFDIHPPLGRLLIWLSAVIGGVDPQTKLEAIGLPFPHDGYLMMRALPRLAGALLPLIVYGIARQIRLSILAAFLVGMLVTLDNALTVVSRIAISDAFILAFGYAGILFALVAARRESPWIAAVSGALVGAAFSVKWTGLAFVGFACVVVAVPFLRHRTPRRAAAPFLCLATAVCVYMGAFAANFAIGHASGRDDAFLSPATQAWLDHSAHAKNPNLIPPGFLYRFHELNKKMYDYSSLGGRRHDFESQWYTWPIMRRPLYFWKGIASNGAEEHIYLIGNPAIWWSCALAMLFLIVNLPARLPRLLRLGMKGRDDCLAELTVCGLFLANYLPFIAITRSMFLYHYLPALTASILGAAILVDRSPRRVAWTCGLLAIAVVGFAWFAPLTYGLPLLPSEFAARSWFHTWR